jgi:hypothetical protein
MPVSPTGAIKYNAGFVANNIAAGFDINHSGYGETVAANTNIRPVPWSNPGTYTIIAQVAGFTPITRSYQITLYGEQDYGALRALVGASGTLTTPREGSPLPGQAQPAILTSLKRGGFQFPGWPNGLGGGGLGGAPPSLNIDLQTAVIEFTMLA